MKIYFILFFFSTSAFAQQKNGENASKDLLNYLCHFSSLDSGVLFFHTKNENEFMDFSSKTINVFSFTKDINTSFLFLKVAINNYSDTTTYFQDENFFYTAQNTSTLKKNINTLKKQLINRGEISAMMNNEIFTGLTADKDSYIKQNDILTFFSNITENDTFIKNTRCKEFTVTYSSADTNMNKDFKKLYFREHDSMLFYFIAKDVYLNSITYTESILDSISQHISKEILIKEINRKKRHFLRSNTIIIDSSSCKTIKRSPMEIGNNLPAFQGTTMNGKKIDIQSIKDKFILLDFWFYACGPCAYSIQPLERLFFSYKDKGLEIISVNAFDDLEVIKRYVKKHSISYMSLQIDKNAENAFAVDGYPSFFLFNPNHKLIYTTNGYSPDLYQELSSVCEKFVHR